MTVQITEIQRVLTSFAHAEQVVVAANGSATDVPALWQPIARCEDAQTRCSVATSLWGSSFLDLVPHFAEKLTTELADVRCGHLRGEAVLVYAFEHFDADVRHVICWIGWDPALARDVEFRFAQAIPDPLRRFYRNVHAGFLAPDWASNGPIQPRHLQTYAEYVGCPQGLPATNWPPDEVAPTRLLVLATTGGDLHVCVSPDLPPGQAMTIYGGVPDLPEDCGDLLDDTMTAQLEDPAGDGT